MANPYDALSDWECLGNAIAAIECLAVTDDSMSPSREELVCLLRVLSDTARRCASAGTAAIEAHLGA